MKCGVEWEERNRWGREGKGEEMAEIMGKLFSFQDVKNLLYFLIQRGYLLKFEHRKKMLPLVGQFMRVLWAATVFFLLICPFSHFNFHTLCTLLWSVV